MPDEPTPLNLRTRHGLHPQLHEVATELHREFDPVVGVERVDRVLDDVAARFADAPVRSFVPLLVYRYARAELRMNSAASSGVAPTDRAPEQAPSGAA